MEQTENEFGIPYKEPEVKNEEQEAVEQPASEEQPKTDEEEEIGEEAREMLAECEKKHRRQYLLEKLWIAVVVMIALSLVGWLVTGRWLNAANNLLWLFIAWMYWRQQKVALSAAEFIVYLLGKTFNLTKQVEHYDKMVKVYGEKDELWRELADNHERQIANNEKLIANLDKSDALRQQIIDKQEELIQRLQ
jgi:uncharacterized membrane protein YcjF (UPF0283 family)